MKSIVERAKEAYPAHEYSVLERVMKRDAYIRGAKEQKAIDEEVRLKKSEDMTKAEYDRETAFADWYLKNGKSTPKNGKSTPTFSDAIEWARKQTINEACEWLHLNLPNIEYTIKEPKPLRVSRGLLIDELKKAMDK